MKISIDFHTDLTKFSEPEIKLWISENQTGTLNVDLMEPDERLRYHLHTAVVSYLLLLDLADSFDLTPPVTPERIQNGEIVSK